MTGSLGVIASVVPGDRPFAAQTGFLDDLGELADARGTVLSVVDPSEEGRGYLWTRTGWRRTSIEPPAVFYDRWLPATPNAAAEERYAQLVRHGTVFNPPRAVRFMADKQLTCDTLGVHVPTPLSCSVADRAGLESLLDAGGSFVLKPRFGSRSRGIHWLEADGRHLVVDRTDRSTVDSLQERFPRHQCQVRLSSDSGESTEIRALVQRSGGELLVTSAYGRTTTWTRVRTAGVRGAWWHRWSV